MLAIISGVSKGLGKELSLKFLAENYTVIGVGRSSDISHDNFKFKYCDLSDFNQVEELEFDLSPFSKVVLINNAGVLGSIKRVSEKNTDDITTVFQVNTIAPSQLMRKIGKIITSNQELIVLNISSGAGRRPIPSWANYCASKAALDSFSQTFQLEEVELNKKTKVFSIAPGVIDTEMQAQIRSTNPTDFSSLTNFIELKKTNNLKSSKETAQELYDFIFNKNNNEVICRL
jgi:benzil reductase ((S)-benzoin forming)